ncbi:ribosomal protein, putative [Plasmodium malariae]|uniref:Large ribosomal subunit protein bL21m n=1 Tax=Plasmodium malariae TaxID=5858 RepID=A0A1A8W9U5_PLAMA|nr:ribosomal protein, putative [Plasmodium malariae]
MLGKHRKRRINPPVYPVHPNEEKKKNLNNFITYKDLKIRWRNTSKNYRKKVTIARKWKNLHCIMPMNVNSCIFVLHKNLPRTRYTQIKKEYCQKEEWSNSVPCTNEYVEVNGYRQKKEYNLCLNKNDGKCAEVVEVINNEVGTTSIFQQDDYNRSSCSNSQNNGVRRGRRKGKHAIRGRHIALNEITQYECEREEDDNELNYYEKPPKELEHIISRDKKDLFCIFKSNFINEHKVTVGDIVQTEKMHRRKAGDVVYFGTVLFVGSKNFSIIGKPTVPYCKVKATIEQITLSKEILSFRYKKVRRSSRFLRIRHWITLLKIDEIIINTSGKIKDERIKPLQILDLWSNRWLYQKELNFIKFDENNNPLAEQIYNLVEHQPNTLHRRGLTDCYRFYPDPHVPHSY